MQQNPKPQHASLVRRFALTVCALAVVFSGCNSVERDWGKAVAANSESAFEVFLKDHGDSARAQEATARLEELVWDKTVRASRKDSWHEYIVRYPKGKHRQDAEARLEEIEWREAETQNTSAAFESFIAAHAGSARMNEARERLAIAKALEVTRSMVVAVRDELRKQSGGATVVVRFLPAVVGSADGSRLKFEVQFRAGDLYTSEFVTNRVAFSRVLVEAPPRQMFGISDDRMLTLPSGWSATFDSERLRSQVTASGLKTGDPVTVVLLTVSRAGVLCGVHPRAVLPVESVASWQTSLASK